MSNLVEQKTTVVETDSTNQPVMADIIETIDAAVDGLCACGCRQAITASSPSAWFAGPGCQDRWHWTRTGAPPDAAGIGQLFTALGRAFEPLADAIVSFVRAVSGPVVRAASLLAALETPPPHVHRSSTLTDGQVHTLERVRSRSTGPTVQPRTPRRIDPSRKH